MTLVTSPSVALCIPAYNAATTLPRLFASAREQTEPFDEIWVYDDASTDDTAALAASLGAHVVRGTTNIGCSAGKNALLARLKAEWVHFFDADDALHPEFVARAKSRIKRDRFQALLFEYEQCDEGNGRQLSRRGFTGSTLTSDPVRFMLTHTINNVGVYCVDFLKRIGGFDTDPAVRYNEDRAFHLRLAESGARFAYEPYTGCRLFYNPRSMSASNQIKCSLAQLEVTRRFAVRHPGKYQREVAELAWHSAGNLATHLAWEEADACVDLAVRNNGRVPTNASKLFAMLCLIDGKLAIRVREHLIRKLKPHLRRST